MNFELVGALEELEKDRGVSRDILIEAIEAAVISAYKRNYGSAQNVSVNINESTGEINVFARKVVVEEVSDESMEISTEEARQMDPEYKVGDVVDIEVTPQNFGRIAAQTAKQVVIQRIREAERAIIYEDYSNREGDIVTGIVQRREHQNVQVDLGRTEAILPLSEQVRREDYSPGSRIKVYITEVRKTPKGPQVIVSRTHPGVLKRLFELEVPEIQEGIVEIREVAREAGSRSKIAVSSRDRNVDPVGACVGPRGMRVQAVVSELKGEKIDVVAWHPDPGRFVAQALSPAKVEAVRVSRDEKSAIAIVPDDKLSLAIGREGQNARLAARLTGMRIDIKSQSQAEFADEESDQAGDEEREAAPTEQGRGGVEEPRAEAMEADREDAVQPVVDGSDLEVEDEREQEDAEEYHESAVETEPFREPAGSEDEEEPCRSRHELKGSPAGPRNRAVRKAQARAQIEEAEIWSDENDEESLPSLFESDEEADLAGEDILVFRSAEDDTEQAQKKQKSGSGKTGTILRHLSELNPEDFDFDE